MATSEYNMESVLIKALETSATITCDIRHRDEDDEAEIDRIIVAVDPKMPAIVPYKPEALVTHWQAMATVTIRQATRDVAALETLCAAVDTVLQASAPSSSVTTFAATLFSTGPLTIDASEEGQRQASGDDSRERSRTYVCRWRD